jgi:hypothetical protein
MIRYAKLSERPGVRSFAVTAHGLLWLGRDQALYHDDRVVRRNDTSLVDYTSANDRLYVCENDTTYVYQHEQLVAEYPLPWSPVPGSLQKDSGVFTYEQHLEQRLFKRARYGLNPFRKLHELPAFNTLGKACFVGEDLFFYNGTLKDISRSTADGTVVWRHPLTRAAARPDEPVVVQQPLGVFGTTFWVYLSSSRLLGLDVETGYPVQYLPPLPDALGLTSADDRAMLSVRRMHLDAGHGAVKCLAHRYYVEVDLRTGRAQIRADFGENGNRHWRITQSTSDGRYLYFSGASQGEPVSRAVGVFDTETAAIVWWEAHGLAVRKYLFYTGAPQAGGRRLYVLDSEDTLHEYERR